MEDCLPPGQRRQYNRMLIRITGRLRAIWIRLRSCLGPVLKPLISSLLSLQVWGFRLYPLLFYGSLLCSVSAIIYLEVRDILDLRRPLQESVQFEISHGGSSTVPSTTSDHRKRSSDSSSSGGTTSPLHHPSSVPEWVLEPAAAQHQFGAVQKDPMQELKECLLTGATLHDCRDRFRKAPAGGATGLKSLLLEDVIRNPPESLVKQKGASKSGSTSSAPVQARRQPSNASAVMVQAMENQLSSLLVTFREAESHESSVCKVMKDRIEHSKKVGSSAHSASHRPTHVDEDYLAMRDGFSSEGQDKYVVKNFLSKNNGFFVDIGTYYGSAPSNTLLLEMCFGWKGVCFEPLAAIPEARVREKLSALRPDCSIVGSAVSQKQGAQTMWILNGVSSRLSVLADKASDQHIDLIGDWMDSAPNIDKRDEEVPSVHLAEALEKLKIGKQPLDLLSISVGSTTLDTLLACDLATLRPAVVVVDLPPDLMDVKEVGKVEQRMQHEGYKLEARFRSSAIFRPI